FSSGSHFLFLIAVLCDVAPCTLLFAICAEWTHFARKFLQFVRDGHTLCANFCNLCVVDTLCTHFSEICVLRTLLARTFLRFVRGRHTLHALFRNLCVV